MRSNEPTDQTQADWLLALEVGRWEGEGGAASGGDDPEAIDRGYPAVRFAVANPRRPLDRI